MAKKMKKLLSFVLVLSMLLSMGSTFAFAAADLDEHNHDGEVSVIEVLDNEEGEAAEETPAVEADNEEGIDIAEDAVDVEEAEEAVTIEELAVLSLEEGAPGYKVKVEVSSVLADGTVTTVTGTVDDNYNAKLVLPDAAVNAGNVTVAVSMKDIDSMGIKGEKTHAITLATGAQSGAQAALRAALGNLYDFEKATVNATIKSGDQEASVVYNFAGKADENGTVITATTDTAKARAAWQLMMKDNFEFVTDKAADSYIVIANGSSMQIGNEKLVFDKDGDLKLDNLTNGIGNANAQIRDMVTLETVADSAVTFTLAAGTELAVDQSSAKLLKDVTVTVDVDADELNAGNILSTLRDAKSVDELIITLVGTLNTVVGAINGKDVDVTIEFTCPKHVEDEGTVTLEPTCTSAGVRTFVCVNCGEVLREAIIPTIPHTAVTDEAVTATCTTEGLTEGSHCSVCDEVLMAQDVIPALGHDIVVDEAVAATCTATGLTEGSHCSRCNDATVEQTVVAALGHDIVTDEAVAATCTTAGLTEGSHCSRCDEATVAQVEVAALGHDIVVDEAVAATCTTTGLTEGSHCSRCDEATVAQTVTEMIAHTPVSANNAVAATYDAPGHEADTVCDVCGTILENGAAIAQLTRPSGGGGGGSTVTPPTVIDEPEVPLAEALPFDDVKDKDWYKAAVQFVYDNDLMNGTTDTTFGPYINTTRGMIVTILWRLENSPAANSAAAFTDVAAGKYYAAAVAWAAENDIVTGYSDEIFAPEKNISRQEMAAILYRYANYKQYDTTGKAELTAYADANSVHSYAVAPIQWAVNSGLIEGLTATTLAPTDGANRAQVATILMRFVNEFTKTETETENEAN